MHSCKDDDDSSSNPSNNNNNDICTSAIELDTSRGNCGEMLSQSSNFNTNNNGNFREIRANSIPDHNVGLFGNVQGALNPNTIKSQNEIYVIPLSPEKANSLTPLLGDNGPDFSFGVMLNGVELDPIAAEPWPHDGNLMSPDVNWEWNLEALNVQIGLDCNNAHVQPNGKYHYHGKPDSYLENLNITSTVMTLIGYAADGFPIYYKYAYSEANNSNSAVAEMSSSYRLKSGERPGDGETAPCDTYNGTYSSDYEYEAGLGTLDEANGREGVTPEYPNGIYYYIVTDEFPSIPRYFRGTPSGDFRI